MACSFADMAILFVFTIGTWIVIALTSYEYGKRKAFNEMEDV